MLDAVSVTNRKPLNALPHRHSFLPGYYFFYNRWLGLRRHLKHTGLGREHQHVTKNKSYILYLQSGGSHNAVPCGSNPTQGYRHRGVLYSDCYRGAV